jgi:putative addiction module killer protein
MIEVRRPMNTLAGSMGFETGRRERGCRQDTALSLGNPGDARPVGEGVSEMHVDYGPGYRIYFVSRGELLVILLAGGDKRTQSRDIEVARRLARNL